jgi:hypothetical protein
MPGTFQSENIKPLGIRKRARENNIKMTCLAVVYVTNTATATGQIQARVDPPHAEVKFWFNPPPPPNGAAMQLLASSCLFLS